NQYEGAFSLALLAVVAGNDSIFPGRRSRCAFPGASWLWRSCCRARVFGENTAGFCSSSSDGTGEKAHSLLWSALHECAPDSGACACRPGGTGRDGMGLPA
ncbi:MAG TPA: hypothetical protein VH592_15960, partial [Gemmataceae bacterium]